MSRTFPLDHPFWRADCRGPALSHAHRGCDGETNHNDCPCRDCGLTPNRWAALVHLNEAEAEADDAILQLPQPGELGVPIMEPGLAKGEYLMWVPSPTSEYAHPDKAPFLGHYVDGDPRGPGRGLMSARWVEYALTTEWLS